MSQVASDAIALAFNPAPPIPPRATPSSDPAPDSPFASLLDDNTQAAAPDPPQTRPAPADSTTDTPSDVTVDAVPGQTANPAADKSVGRKTGDKTAGKTTTKTTDKAVTTAADTSAIATSPNSIVSPVNPDKGKPAEMNGETTVAKAADGSKVVQTALQTVNNTETADAANAAGANALPTTSKVPGNTKATTDTKSAEHTKATDPADDGKPTDAAAPVALVADPTKNPIQTIVPAVAVAPTPTPTVVNPPATGHVSQTAPVTSQAAIVVANAPEPKSPDLAPGQDSIEKLTATQNGTAKPAAAKDGTAKLVPDHPQDEDVAVDPRSSAQTSTSNTTDAQPSAPKPTGDAVQQAALTPPSPNVSPAPTNPTVPAAPTEPTAPTAQTALTPPAAAVPIAGVAVEISNMAQAGKNHFEIRLDPPELGRIEVRLDVDHDGHTTTSLIADRSDTLNLLRQDSSGLERALQDAGLKTTGNGLQFSLRDQTMGNQQGNTPAPASAHIVVQDNTLPVTDMTQNSYSRLAGLRGGIDIRV